MQKGTVWYNGKMYLTDNNGAVISTNGWYLKKGDWYYINKDSSIVTDEFKEIDGKLYYFEYDGVMKMGISIYMIQKPELQKILRR